MHKLIFALALAPALAATAVQAQTAPDDAAKALWCSEAFTVLFASEKSTVPADQMDQFNLYVAAVGKVMDKASQDYLAAGFTQAQLDKVKTDLVAEVTPAVTTGAAGKYGPGDCNPLLAPYLPIPAPGAAAPDASAPPAPASAPADMSSSSAQ
jgi:outer membrane protein W